MKLYFFSFLFCIFNLFVNAQEFEGLSKKERKELAREERKAKRLEEEKKRKEWTEILLKQHKFVLEAEYVSGSNGQQFPVQSSINFVVVDSLKGVVQLGFPNGLGYNGLGGITLDGRISKYELKEKENKKDKSYTLLIYIVTAVGTYDISFHITSIGNASATVRGMYRGRLTYSGQIVPIGLSNIYKGSSIY